MDWLNNLISGGGGNATSFSANENVANINPGITPAPDGGSGVSKLFADPNFQSLLAGTGAALDPNGVGGAMGKATLGMIQSKQMGKAVAKQDGRWTALIEALGSGKIGSASVKTDEKGGTSMSLKAPEVSLGALNQPSAAAVSPDAGTQVNPFNAWFNKYFNAGV